MLYVAIVLVSYSVFVFVSESINPLGNVKSAVKRRRFEFGRKLGLIVLCAGVIVHFVGSLSGLSLVLQLLVFAALSCCMIFLNTLQFFKRNHGAISIR